MRAWLESIAGPEYASAMIWTLAALILLLVILVVVRIVRGLTFGTFVAGGRNRKTRLAVMDATAVDSHRRLVLVRRDDVEHLILIGGPTDVVVEQNIRLQTPGRRPLPAEPRDRLSPDEPAARQSPDSLKPPPAAATLPAEPAPPARPPETPRPATPAVAQPTPRPAGSYPAASSTAGSTPPTPPSARPAAAPAAAPVTDPKPAAAPAGAKGGELDDKLLKELEVTLNEKSAPDDGETLPKQVDEEMSRLLGELSPRRDK